MWLIQAMCGQAIRDACFAMSVRVFKFIVTIVLFAEFSESIKDVPPPRFKDKDPILPTVETEDEIIVEVRKHLFFLKIYMILV
jgi:hypothetical protein